MLYTRVKILRDNQTTYNTLVVPWEVPILEFIFADGNVEILGTEEVPNSVYPVSAAEEFQRLKQKYGEDSETGIAQVASVYGNAARGVRALQSAIEDAKKAEQEAQKPRRAPASKPVGRKAAATADSLMD